MLCHYVIKTSGESHILREAHILKGILKRITTVRHFCVIRFFQKTQLPVCCHTLYGTTPAEWRGGGGGGGVGGGVGGGGGGVGGGGGGGGGGVVPAGPV